VRFIDFISLYVMKILTSYFYNVRFFKPNMIPLSTAVWDPKWFHNFKNQNHVWKDKNGVWNGLRLEELNPKNCHAGGCPCDKRDYKNCRFLSEYRQGLKAIDFDNLIKTIEKISNLVKESEGFCEEPEIILLVHEAKDNPCSERVPIQELFREHGIEIKEWKKI